MPGKALDVDTIAALLGGQAQHDAKNLKVNREGPLKVLVQSDNCAICARVDKPAAKRVTAMYTVNGTPLCGAHAMYRLSEICVENNYKAEITAIVPEPKGML